MFEKKMLENEIFQDQFFSFDWYPDEKVLPSSAFRNAEVLPSGDVIIRIGAPEAHEVKVIAQFGKPDESGYCPWEDTPVYGTKDENGIFTCLLPYDPHHTGSRSLKVYIDSTLVIWPYLPVGWGSNRIQNYIEVPDEQLRFSYIENVPHGAVISQLFYSDIRKKHSRLMIYTPPGYGKITYEYPVLYLLHGGSDNETTWFSRAKIQYIFDNLLAEEKCVPFICVCLNDMATYGKESPSRKWEKTDGITEDVLINEVIPFIEDNYRVKKDKNCRAIGGLSLGALQACDCGFRHPEIFGSMGFLTSILEHESYDNAKGRPWKRALENPEKVAADYRLIFCSATPQEDHFDYFLNDRKIMKEAGLEELMKDRYVYRIHDGRFTRWCSWRIGMQEFAQLLFRE
ncbi:MAG: hypothetical protein IJM15_08650 [Erysipelotrichaceae bacterium]|nr:hypothetical protein [Erysipelotrichaceae bacterium]